jgi:hypothetical protein
LTEFVREIDPATPVIDNSLLRLDKKGSSIQVTELVSARSRTRVPLPSAVTRFSLYFAGNG